MRDGKENVIKGNNVGLPMLCKSNEGKKVLRDKIRQSTKLIAM